MYVLWPMLLMNVSPVVAFRTEMRKLLEAETATPPTVNEAVTVATGTSMSSDELPVGMTTPVRILAKPLRGSVELVVTSPR